MPRCANIGLDFPLRETTLFGGILRCIEGCDLPQFGSICLMLIFTGIELWHTAPHCVLVSRYRGYSQVGFITVVSCVYLLLVLCLTFYFSICHCDNCDMTNHTATCSFFALSLMALTSRCKVSVDYSRQQNRSNVFMFCKDAFISHGIKFRKM